MKSPKVAIIAPYKEMRNDAEEIIAEFGLNAYVVEGDLKEGVKAAKLAVSNGAEAIVSRSGTAFLIAKSVEIPVVGVEISPYDVIRCLAAFKGHSGPIGVVGFQKLVYGCNSIGGVLGLDLREIVISSEEEMPDKIAEAASQGIQAVLGGATAIHLAARFAIQGVLLTSGKEALAKAIYDAIRIAEVRIREKERAELLKLLVNSSQAGIIAIDQNERVTLFNPAAEKIIGIQANDIIGSKILHKLPDSELPQIVRNKTFELESLRKFQDKLVVVKRFAIRVNNETIGAFENLQDMSEIQRLEQLVRQRLHAKGLVAHSTLENITGTSQPILALKQKAKKYAKAESSLLIMGESGTGKEILAQGIHNCSSRSKGPFVAVNCAALPESLLESELFGYAEGAFTGAKKGGKQGLFELAHGGSIFLDEIGEMPLPLQSRLLRVLQEHSVLRVGGNSIIPVDVRVIASTNRNIHELIEKGQFRQDLYYRINTLTLLMPPLRDRPGDISVLVEYFIKKHARINPMVRSIDAKALKLLDAYYWPGNVRELEHAIERMLILAETEIIETATVTALLADLRTDRQWGYSVDSDVSALQEMEAGLIQKVLEEENYNKTKAAKRLGVSRSTLWRKLGPSNNASK
ncbi:MAG: sigma 54-interacting transcriptional regulator [Negativicutes bacterium]|nr:sigma 54-interacting transcriptional regulator [Negativicutes bacterium]